MMSSCLLLSLLHIVSPHTTTSNTDISFGFTNVHGDNMVLQQAPNRAQVHGTSPTINDVIAVTLSDSKNQIIQSKTSVVNQNNSWFVQFDPQPASINNETYSVVATSTSHSSQTAQLNNILFGDVYICSGQSNMQFTVDSAFNASESLYEANNYPNIRLLSVDQTSSTVPLNQVISLKQPWSIASNTSVGGGNWTYFSALCWFFGKNLYDELRIPLGLIATNFGGTPVRSWMSPDALKLCPNETKGIAPIADVSIKGKGYDFTKAFVKDNISVTGSQDSLHYNAMIVPFLPMTIKGAIWYQGESDANKDEGYAVEYYCAFPAMITDWRAKWNYYSDTDGDFAFGYIQISTWDDYNNGTCGQLQNTTDVCIDVARVRYGQSANYGYVPNPKQQNVYMATAIDLGDATSPFGSIHPRYKQQVAKRLSDAALNMIYGRSKIYWQGPIAHSVAMDENNVMIKFRNVNEDGLVLNRLIGFEVFDQNSGEWVYIEPLDANIQLSGLSVVEINYNTSNISVPTQLRYNWYQAPCMSVEGIYGCSVYDKKSNLPATPFIMSIDPST